MKASHLLQQGLSLLLSGVFLLCGGCGFFGSRDVSVQAPASIKGEHVVKTAYAQLGKKYRAGGASPQKGFDCSGLVWWSYGQLGVKIPRITTEQARAGRSVHKRQARAGDIMVFRSGASPRGLHTGIYTGDGKFIHSPSAGKTVRIERLADWWGSRLIAVRRIVR